MRRSRNVLCHLLAIVWLASGCTTTYMPSTDADTHQIRIKTGDRIRVVTTRRERLTFDVTEVRQDRFVGTLSQFPSWDDNVKSGGAVEVPFDELALIRITSFNLGAAALTSVMAVVTVTALGVVIGAAAVPVVPPVVP